MKSLYLGKVVGNTKLRGKLHKLLACGCCEMFNAKQKYRLLEVDKEIKNVTENERSYKDVLK